MDHIVLDGCTGSVFGWGRCRVSFGMAQAQAPARVVVFHRYSMSAASAT